MGLRGKMGNAGDCMLFEQPADQRRIPDIALDEVNAAVGDQRLEAAQIRRIGHRIDHDEAVLRSRGAPRVHQILSDETGAAGYKNALHQRLLPSTGPKTGRGVMYQSKNRIAMPWVT